MGQPQPMWQQKHALGLAAVIFIVAVGFFALSPQVHATTSISYVYKSQFGSPNGLVFAPSGNVYIADSFPNHRIEVFSSTGVYQSQFGSEGSGNGQFEFPHAIARDA